MKRRAAWWAVYLLLAVVMFAIVLPVDIYHYFTLPDPPPGQEEPMPLYRPPWWSNLLGWVRDRTRDQEPASPSTRRPCYCPACQRVQAAFRGEDPPIMKPGEAEAYHA